ncbi:MAG: phage tail protein I [Magnetococcales bacterium]|nr:phage tail protein I [Magnetococcales bacterium]
MKTLLPANASELERDLEQVAARIDEIPVPIKHLWNPHTCPIELLPWLAWALSIDFWHEQWPEERKRQVIADSILWHSKKGTIGAVKSMLEKFGVVASVSEWFEYGGDPFTFKVDMTSGGPVTKASIDQAISAIAASKNSRSHLEKITVNRTHNGSVYRGMTLQNGKNIKINLRFLMSAIKPANNYVASIMHKGKKTAIYINKPLPSVDIAQKFTAVFMSIGRVTTIYPV